MDTPGPGMYLALLLLLAFSAFFSASETALSSVNRIRMKNKADDGDKKAQRVLGLSDDYDRTLSAILIGNNVVNLTASSISTVIATSLLGQQGAAVATAVITVLVLVFGEILPKSFAKDHAERVSMAMGGPLYIVKTLLAPLVWVFVQIKRLFTGRRSSELNVQPSVTEEELKTIIDTVGEEGVLDRQETDIIQSAIEFDNTTVQDILVPRVDMAAGGGGAARAGRLPGGVPGGGGARRGRGPDLPPTGKRLPLTHPGQGGDPRLFTADRINNSPRSARSAPPESAPRSVSFCPFGLLLTLSPARSPRLFLPRGSTPAAVRGSPPAACRWDLPLGVAAHCAGPGRRSCVRRLQ